jgi:hypothetical protein
VGPVCGEEAVGVKGERTERAEQRRDEGGDRERERRDDDTDEKRERERENERDTKACFIKNRKPQKISTPFVSVFSVFLPYPVTERGRREKERERERIEDVTPPPPVALKKCSCCFLLDFFPSFFLSHNFVSSFLSLVFLVSLLLSHRLSLPFPFSLLRNG